jgi:hypothetical protein
MGSQKNRESVANALIIIFSRPIMFSCSLSSVGGVSLSICAMAERRPIEAPQRVKLRA